jgi:LacI family transcriptional regulator
MAKDRVSHPPPRATLRTIAELTGLSLSTVSLSLRGGEALRPETRQRVLEAAATVGYVPDRAGVRLRTGRTNVVALVIDTTEDSIDFTRRLIAGIGAALRETRYHLTVMPELVRPVTTDTIDYILANRAADGVILTHTHPDDVRVARLAGAGFPFVTHGRTRVAPAHAFHDFHAEAFIRLAVSRLLEKQRRHLALVIGSETTTNRQTIVSNFRSAAKAAGARATILDSGPIGARPTTLRALGETLATASDGPDGIICDSELGALALLAGLTGAGAELGRDFDFVGKQISEVLPALFPQLDTIVEDVDAAGRELTRLLMERIAGSPIEDLQTLGEPRPIWRS